MKYYIGLDVGTSSVKAVIMDENNNVLNNVNVKHNYYYDNGLKLLDADEFCEGCFEAIRRVSENFDKNNIESVCTSGASGNLMFVSNGQAISPVYGWQNTYDIKLLEKHLPLEIRENVYNIIGWPLLNSFPLAAMCYLKENNAELFEKSDMICMNIEYFAYKLTGKWGITASMGTPFYLIDQVKGNYSKPILDCFGINEDKLPPIMKNFSVLGKLTKYASKKTGLSTETKLVLGLFDHPSAAVGAEVLNEGGVLVSCGTSWVVFLPYKDRETPASKNMLLDRFLYPEGNWGAMVSIESVADKIDNYKKKYLGVLTYDEFDSLAKKGKGLNIDFENNSDIEQNSKEDIAASIIEYIANMLKENIDKYAPESSVIYLSGGISNSKVWLKAIERVTERQIRVVNGECAGAAGAAKIAMQGSNFGQETD